MLKYSQITRKFHVGLLKLPEEDLEQLSKLPNIQNCYRQWPGYKDW